MKVNECMSPISWLTLKRLVQRRRKKNQNWSETELDCTKWNTLSAASAWPHQWLFFIISSLQTHVYILSFVDINILNCFSHHMCQQSSAGQRISINADSFFFFHSLPSFANEWKCNFDKSPWELEIKIKVLSYTYTIHQARCSGKRGEFESRTIKVGTNTNIEHCNI